MSRLIRRKLLMSRRSGAGRIACARFYRPIPRRVNSDRLLEGADLDDAHLEGANLGGADLSGAYLRRARLSGVTGLSEAQLRSADGDAATIPPEGMTPPVHWHDLRMTRTNGKLFGKPVSQLDAISDWGFSEACPGGVERNRPVRASACRSNGRCRR